ncbi:MAG: hypothetical protein K1X92_12990 [Bacteroidia bacterium]|nr:hypothetical protein [Bacteroidia bacterium]
MKTQLLIICLFFLGISAVKADKILADMDFSNGEWVMVGVPLHNYQLLPVQQEMGTFICKDVAFMQDIQKVWDFEYTNEDKCDYHYTLKFYQNKELKRTVTLNLHCGYVTSEGLSYFFDPVLFNRFKAVSKPVDWSRINFEDQEVLKKAITRLSKAKDIYWYEDVKPYLYKGFVMMSFNNLPWDANQDSLQKTVEAAIKAQVNSSDFYVFQKGYQVDNDLMYVSYQVNCNENIAKKMDKMSNMITSWKPHMTKGEVLRVVAIGVDEERYGKIMSGNE